MSRDQHRIGLLDRLLRHGAEPWEHLESIETGSRNVLNSVADAPAIIADNVAEYYYAVDDREHWNFTDFPNVAPPFGAFWIETRHPSRVRTRAWPSDTDAWVGPPSWGAAFNVLDKDEENLRGALDFNASRGGPDPLLFLSARWLVQVTMYVESMDGALRGPLLAAILPVEQSGAIAPTVLGGPMYVFVPPTLLSDDGSVLADRASAVGIEMLKPLLLAVSFMHCTNVTREPREAPKKMSRAWQRRGGGRPLRRYEVLDIEPMKRTLAAEGRSGEVGHRKSLHICRGHFRDYREGPGLFGRLHGMYWVESHARGSSTIGTVVKDYRVKQPQPEGVER